MNYYNEIDPYAAQWLRNLIDAGHIARGDVDERSIADVRPDDLAGYTQCHFFAGIGGWSFALRLAGWPDARPVWTGSCPCQPFSSAGKGEAADDERHLWPAWFPLIAQRRPPVVFGEQVEAALGWGWLDAVFADLEGEGYACGTTVLPACGIGAPHIRQRAWFVADATRQRERSRITRGNSQSGQFVAGPEPRRDGLDNGKTRDVADSEQRGLESGRQRSGASQTSLLAEDCRPRILVDAAGEQVGIPGRPRQPGNAAGELGVSDGAGLLARHEAPAPNGHRHPAVTTGWDDLDWLPCTDGKARPVESGTFPLAHGIPGRVGRLRAYGNAIVPQVAAEFIKAASD